MLSRLLPYKTPVFSRLLPFRRLIHCTPGLLTGCKEQEWSKDDHRFSDNQKLWLGAAGFAGLFAAAYATHENVVYAAEEGADETEEAEDNSTVLGAFKTIRDKVKKQFANAYIPEHVPYVLVGGGMASYYAALTIRAFDPNAQVLIVSASNETPYNRPPLSKELWLYGTERAIDTLEYIGITGKKRDIRYESDGFFVQPGSLKDFEHGAVALIRNTYVVAILPETKQVILDTGRKVRFDKLLIATGSKPELPFPFYVPHMRNKVMTYSRASDFRKLSNVVEVSKSILVYGDSQIANELAFSLSTKYNHLTVHQAYEEPYPLYNKVPPHIGDLVKHSVQSTGVKVLAGAKPLSIDKLPNGQVELIFDVGDGETQRVVVDHVVVSGNYSPAQTLAKNADLKIDEVNGGVVTDSYLRTSHSNIFAAGDVASFHDPVLGQRRVVESDHAQITGRLAGQNMTGHLKEFHRRSANLMNLGHALHLNFVGHTDPSIDTVSVFSPKNTPDEVPCGIVFYVKNKKVIGILLVNVFGVGIELARRIVADNKEVKDFIELAKVFDIYVPDADSTPESAASTVEDIPSTV